MSWGDGTVSGAAPTATPPGGGRLEATGASGDDGGGRRLTQGAPADSAWVEAVIDEELGAFLDSGPTEAELARAQTSRRASFVRGVELIGGFRGKPNVLAQSEVYLGAPTATCGRSRTSSTPRPPTSGPPPSSG